jgi:FUS-interacting serine-arginine-rich protein 1
MSGRHQRNLSASLYVRGISEKCRYEDLKKIFGRYGRIVDITLPLDYYTRDAKGYGFVEYEESRDAEEALHALDRYRLLGRELEVEFARGDRKTPSEMRAREKESRHSGGRGGGGDFGRRGRSRSRDRRQRSGSPVGGRDRRREASRSRSPYSRSPVQRRGASRSRSKSNSPSYGKRNGASGGASSGGRRVSRSRSPPDN